MLTKAERLTEDEALAVFNANRWPLKGVAEERAFRHAFRSRSQYIDALERLLRVVLENADTMHAALDKLNNHHTHDHHHDDPDMPLDEDVAEGFFAYRKMNAARWLVEEADSGVGGGS